MHDVIDDTLPSYAPSRLASRAASHWHAVTSAAAFFLLKTPFEFECCHLSLPHLDCNSCGSDCCCNKYFETADASFVTKLASMSAREAENKRGPKVGDAASL
jgi:hypothetical protein